jgi:hypothetical protein
VRCCPGASLREVGYPGRSSTCRPCSSGCPARRSCTFRCIAQSCAIAATAAAERTRTGQPIQRIVAKLLRLCAAFNRTIHNLCDVAHVVIRIRLMKTVCAAGLSANAVHAERLVVAVVDGSGCCGQVEPRQLACRVFVIRLRHIRVSHCSGLDTDKMIPF